MLVTEEDIPRLVSMLESPDKNDHDLAQVLIWDNDYNYDIGDINDVKGLFIRKIYLSLSKDKYYWSCDNHRFIKGNW